MKIEALIIALSLLFLVDFVSADTNSTNTTINNTFDDPSEYSIGFDLGKTRIQLGDSILIKGTVYKDNQIMRDQVNMIFYFTSGNSQNQIFLSVFDGTFSLSPKLKDLPTGTYQITVKLVDLNGNEIKKFENIQTLVIDNQLLLNLKLDDDNLDPGDRLKILGTVTRNLDKTRVPSGVVTVVIDGEEHITEISNGNLDYEIILDDNIASGYHDIKVRVEDNFGNYGETVLNTYIVPKQESLQIVLEKKTYLPGENIDITISLFDQANQEIKEEVNVRIYNPKDKKIFEEDTTSSSTLRYSLEDAAFPGEWKIIAKSKKLETEKFIEVPVIEEIDTELITQTLKVTNIGNVKYEKPLTISAISQEDERTLTIRTNLNPGDEMYFDLYKSLRDLDYNIKINNTDQTFDVKIRDDRGIFEKTGDFFKSVTGQAIRVSGSKNSNAASYFLGALVTVLVVFGFLFKNKKIKIINRRKRSEKPKIIKSRSKTKKFFKKESDKEDIEEFKSRILKDIEKAYIREEKKKETSPFEVQPFFDLPKVQKKEEPEKKPRRFYFDRPYSKDK